MDFVRTDTGKPVNSPFQYELWRTADVLSARPSARLTSMERTWGIKQKDIDPGEEKFLLRDGMTCVLKRPGCKDLRFTVPVRVTPTENLKVPDADELDFPQFVH